MVPDVTYLPPGGKTVFRLGEKWIAQRWFRSLAPRESPSGMSRLPWVAAWISFLQKKRCWIILADLRGLLLNCFLLLLFELVSKTVEACRNDGLFLVYVYVIVILRNLCLSSLVPCFDDTGYEPYQRLVHEPDDRPWAADDLVLRCLDDFFILFSLIEEPFSDDAYCFTMFYPFGHTKGFLEICLGFSPANAR